MTFASKQHAGGKRMEKNYSNTRFKYQCNATSSGLIPVAIIKIKNKTIEYNARSYGSIPLFGEKTRKKRNHWNGTWFGPTPLGIKKNQNLESNVMQRRMVKSLLWIKKIEIKTPM
jgi:hypothetical protein